MKRQMHEVPLDFRKGTVFDIEIPDPGIVRETLIVLREKSGSIIMNDDKEKYDLVPVAIFEIDPDAPLRKRRFFILPPTQIIDLPNIEYQGTFIHPKGMLLHFFEEIPV